MAIPFEAAPATVFKESDIAEFGLALQDRQEAKQAQERERYEKMLESVSGPYWAERDTWVTQGGNKLLEMATDPAYYKAPIGSENHNKFIRAKRQYEQLLATSAANQKYFNEQLKFAQQNPDAEGMQDLNAYVGMDMQGDVEIDEAGNFVVAGQPIITSDAMSTPPSLRKRRDVYTFDKFEDRVNVGISSYENENGVTTVSPNDAEALVRIVYKTSRPQDKRDLLNIYMANNLGLTAEQVDMLDPEEIAIYEEAMLKEQAKAALLRSDTKTSRESGGGRGGLLGEFDKKSFVKIEPQFGKTTVVEGAEFKSGISVPTVKFVSTQVVSEGDVAQEDGDGTQKGSEGDVAQIIHADKVAQDKDGNLYISGKKYTGDIKRLISGGLASPDGSGGFSIDPSATDELLGSFGWKSRPLEPMKLEGTDASSFVAAMRIKGVNSVDQFKKAMDDFYGVTSEPTEQVAEVEVEENKKKEGDMTDEEYEQFLKDNGLK
jgi:hypothetical protein